MRKKATQAEALRRALGVALAIGAMALLAASAWPASAPRPDSFASAGLATPAALPLPLAACGPVAVNAADAAALQALPGVGEALAQAILAERAAHGPFYYPEDLLAARGIGQKRLDALRDWLDLSPGEAP